MLSQTFNIALPRDLVRRADQVARKEYRNRSELIREALRVYLDEKLRWLEIFKSGELAARRIGVAREQDVDALVSKFRHGTSS